MSQSQGTSQTCFRKVGRPFLGCKKLPHFLRLCWTWALRSYNFFATFLALGFVFCDFSLCTMVNHHHFGEVFLGVTCSKHQNHAKIQDLHNHPSPLITPWLCPPCSPGGTWPGGSGCLSTCQIIGDENPSVL